MTMNGTVHVIPGDRLHSGVNNDNIGGLRTHVFDGQIYSSLAGRLCTTQTQEGQKCHEVISRKIQNVLPEIGSRVVVRITKVNARFCKCSIIRVEKTLLDEPFHGMIRREDVRATEKDKVELYRCFRPGDIVIAKVLSLGDAQSYVLTTAENELGVASATSEAGHPLLPISWKEMQCPKTMLKEFRKVANVQPEYWTH